MMNYHLTKTERKATISLCIDLLALERAATCSKPSELVHYIIVRKDLPTGDQIAQACHAAGESPGPRPEPGCTVVVLHALDEQHLKIIAARLDKSGIAYGTVTECPDDVDYPNQMMSIGCAPTEDRGSMRKALSSLPLARYS